MNETMKTYCRNRISKTLKICRENFLDWRLLLNFTVTLEDGTTWVNQPPKPISDPWDLWLVKKGTQGKTAKTLKRIYLKDKKQ